MTKNTVLFYLKALFVLKVFKKLCPYFFGHVVKQPDKKAKVNFEIYGVIICRITVHIFANISRSKGNVNYIFLKKSCRKFGSETGSTHLFVIRTSFIRVKTSGQHLSFNTFS